MQAVNSIPGNISMRLLNAYNLLHYQCKFEEIGQNANLSFTVVVLFGVTHGEDDISEVKNMLNEAPVKVNITCNLSICEEIFALFSKPDRNLWCGMP